MKLLHLLESRRLLDASLSNGILAMNGSAGNDVISVWVSSVNRNRVVVYDGAQEFSFAKRDVRLIRINAGRGDDVIAALVVNDRPVDIRLSINAGAGDDLVTGGAADDSIVGETGNDTIRGGGGAGDFVDYRYVDAPAELSTGNTLGVIAQLTPVEETREPGGFVDELHLDLEGVIGTAFDDRIIGNSKPNTLIGSSGHDELFGQRGDDRIEGDQGGKETFGNRMSGGSGDDTLLGFNGDQQLDDFGDTFEGDDGDDVLLGGAANDLLDGGPGGDRIDGGRGFDRIIEINAPEAAEELRVSFDEEANDGAPSDGFGDNYIDLEQMDVFATSIELDARGLSHGLLLFLDGGRATVQGSEFNDFIVIRDGGLVHGNGGSDSIQAMGAPLPNEMATIFGGAGNDIMHGFNCPTTMFGEGGNDKLFGQNMSIVADGGPGRDTLAGGPVDDQLTGGAGADHFAAADHDAGDVTDFQSGADVLD
jgi:Ca2+-binding RTX toxin-like protein